MCDGTPNGVGVTERLKRLQNSQTLWKNSVWSQPDQFPYSELKKMSSYPTAVSGNLMVFQSTIMVADSIMLLLLRFPSELRGIPERQWYLRLEFAHIECVSADDSQDLLVFSSSVSNLEPYYSHAQLEMPLLVYQISTFGRSLQEKAIL
jgi:hypothetical protein